MNTPPLCLIRPPLIRHGSIRSCKHIPRPMQIIRHQVHFRENSTDLFYLDFLNLVWATGQGGCQAVEAAALGSEVIKLEANGLEEEGKVLGVGGRARVVFVARILPININPIKAIRINHIRTLQRKRFPLIQISRNPREIIAQRPPPNTRHDLHAHTMRQVNDPLVNLMIVAIAIGRQRAIPAAKVICVVTRHELLVGVVDVGSP
mmetsp:Transcript_10866/g.19239  ORF Transcript_10866/g.19239 Transcript_10866/m.19239 type:complete len:205 (+) Transcript_10866:1-615(+)